MVLLAIGEFAKAAGLSPKAVRLYGELGLLTPTRVDPVSGYRFYDPRQLERARLVAWLRRLGMPLAQIKAVCALEPAAAATAVKGYWQRVEDDVSARRDMAAALIAHLSGPADVASAAGPALVICCAALTDVGLVRAVNADMAYAGSHLAAVADGFGTGGAAASAAAIDALKDLDRACLAPEAPGTLTALRGAVQAANQAVARIAAAAGPDAGTTLTAMLWTGSRIALAHIGDSRAYLRRGGDFYQITHDHTLVQFMIDQGRITPDEAASHPQRALLLRALDGDGASRPDLRWQDAQPGDRYLLCSDGLAAVVAAAQIQSLVAGATTPAGAVAALVAAARRAGAPDNIACAVADVSAG